MNPLPGARVIVNPRAGAGATGKKWPYIIALLQNTGLRFEYDFTQGLGHATELAKLAAESGYKLVIAVGGDGTINEVVNGLYAAGRIGDVMLGIIGTGIGSDFIHSIGIPRLPKDACHCLINPRKLAVDLGVIEYTRGGQKLERLFVNFAGLGLAAEIVKATQRYKAMSIPRNVAGLLTAFLFHKNREVSVTLDGETGKGRVCAVLVNNGKYAGRGMLIVPGADLGDGVLDALIIDDLRKVDLIRLMPGIYKGTHLTHPRVTLKRAREIEIQSTPQMLSQADGELLGETPARFYVLPTALNVIF